MARMVAWAVLLGLIIGSAGWFVGNTATSTDYLLEDPMSLKAKKTDAPIESFYRFFGSWWRAGLIGIMAGVLVGFLTSPNRRKATKAFGIGLLLVLTIAVGGLAANSYRKLAESADVSVKRKDLHDIYQAFLASWTNLQDAGSLEDLKPYLEPKLLQSINDGRYVIVFGHNPRLVMRKDNVILAYEKDAPSKGGEIVTLAGSNKTMTATELENAIKIRQ
jgi:hypothetical protein